MGHFHSFSMAMLNHQRVDYLQLRIFSSSSIFDCEITLFPLVDDVFRQSEQSPVANVSHETGPKQRHEALDILGSRQNAIISNEKTMVLNHDVLKGRNLVMLSQLATSQPHPNAQPRQQVSKGLACRVTPGLVAVGKLLRCQGPQVTPFR